MLADQFLESFMEVAHSKFEFIQPVAHMLFLLYLCFVYHHPTMRLREAATDCASIDDLPRSILSLGFLTLPYRSFRLLISIVYSFSSSWGSMVLPTEKAAFFGVTRSVSLLTSYMLSTSDVCSTRGMNNFLRGLPTNLHFFDPFPYYHTFEGDMRATVVSLGRLRCWILTVWYNHSF